ncbi:UDP-N-acetylglucosamine--N-acetylmuramyl-(pentapeptide) pyrophosphoryl-undecaprenol N-acetylglucosamine transferase [Candidatus Gottesmanbacteria bacterium]|nr:UDP-N-acetylglucosamine--N-acetylmuramyl-(pentapeptide) pyrophosphoryl-undecaprenol N-acetylglucosamine transferase [Candidatus Gottesmanbacteria bacterium]
MQKTIFITGGHVTPAIAVIEEIRKRKLPWRIVFVGRKNALEGEKTVSPEYSEITGMGIPFLSLVAGRITRTVTPFIFLSWLKIPFGFFQAFWYVALYRPKLVISFGGYVAVPMAIAAAVFRIPVVTHEQTLRLGLANRIISIFAKKVFYSFVTGLPVRQALFHPPANPTFKIPKDKPILYITGGSTGAVSLNERLHPLLKDMRHTWCIIHQLGQQSHREELGDTYVTAPYFSTTDVAWIYKHADLVIARAGANTVWELAALGKIALLVPLPWSAAEEQRKNAQWLAAKGSAVVLEQRDATAERLKQIIDEMIKNKSQRLAAAKELSAHMPRDGAKRMVDEIATMVAA